jgi:uncharacterized protein YdhG (YjbR/CyaY superfamily)
MAKPLTVDEYIGSFSGPAQARLRELRELSRAAAPETTEELKWGHPAYSLETILFVFSGHQNHANLVFTPSTRERSPTSSRTSRPARAPCSFRTPIHFLAPC